eukprot:767729-Hanusia_phi.AAC.2
MNTILDNEIDNIKDEAEGKVRRGQEEGEESEAVRGVGRGGKEGREESGRRDGGGIGSGWIASSKGKEGEDQREGEKRGWGVGHDHPTPLAEI